MTVSTTRCWLLVPIVFLITLELMYIILDNDQQFRESHITELNKKPFFLTNPKEEQIEELLIIDSFEKEDKIQNQDQDKDKDKEEDKQDKSIENQDIGPSQNTFELSETDNFRREAVKEGFLHAWNNYKTYAWGKDELKPISRGSQNWMNLGLTIVDALDTLVIMDLHSEVREAVDWVAQNLNFDRDMEVSFFETTIRSLGGLLSAYELTGEKVLLEKAKDLGMRLHRAFDNSPHGIPYSSINLQTGRGQSPSWAAYSSMLSEISSVQLEFSVLAHHLNDPSIARKPAEVFKKLDALPKGSTGLYSVYISTTTGSWGPTERVTLGALGDSFYEYLIKMWILTNKQIPLFKKMYDVTSEAIINYMTIVTKPSQLTFLAELSNKNLPPVHITKMDHLVCFAGAMFALGAETDDRHNDQYRDRHLQYGKNITQICHEMYARTPTGIAPEITSLNQGNDIMVNPGAKHYLLRPETVESYFVLYRLTGDKKYQEWGWEAFQAIEKYCRVKDGYSGIHDVTAIPVSYDDVQQSFFLAETLKYLYLLFSPPDLIPLDQYVFNTEAHPLRILNDDAVARLNFKSFL